ncbi:MAG: DUF459 domain-containing protein [Thermoleophilia bacterium]|nr:DUF459 domain-containing protein [Thermoleophilia bacterium]
MAEARGRRRRPRRREAEGGRRLHSAGSAVVVSALALSFSLLLNAPGLHKSASSQPSGWKRELALGVTGPLEELSSTLLLDRPRRALKAALGRSQDDVIDTRVVVPEREREGPQATPARPRRPLFTSARPLRIWIAGDSLVVVPGESILRAIAGRPSVVALGAVDGRLATGLERPDVFNWFTHVRDVMRSRRPNAVVLMVGANDDHGFMTGVPEGVAVGPFGSGSWEREYRRRVAGIMDAITGSGAYLLWIGLPITRDPEQTRRYDTINAIVQSEAARRRDRVAYIDTYLFFAGPDGRYAQYVADGSGRLVKVRADDGVHFERAAGDRIAAEVLRRLEARFRLRDARSPTH